MFYLKKLISALILPPTGPLLVALFGIWLARRHRRLGNGLAIAMLIGLLLLCMPPVASALMRTLEVYAPISASQLAGVQAIVVLGGGDYPRAPEYGADTVGADTLERLRYAAELQRVSGRPILVTGGSFAGETPAGDTMKASLERDFGAKVRWTENAALDTVDNAAYAARLLKKDNVTRIAVLSHGWHLRRAVPLFEREGLVVVPAPTRFTTRPPSLFFYLLPHYDSLAKSSTALREWLGILAQHLAASVRS